MVFGVFSRGIDKNINGEEMPMTKLWWEVFVGFLILYIVVHRIISERETVYN